MIEFVNTLLRRGNYNELTKDQASCVLQRFEKSKDEMLEIMSIDGVSEYKFKSDTNSYGLEIYEWIILQFVVSVSMIHPQLPRPTEGRIQRGADRMNECRVCLGSSMI